MLLSPPRRPRVRPDRSRTRQASRVTRELTPARDRACSRTRPSAAAGPARLSDEALLARYRDDRRPEDFAELHRRYSRELSNYLARYLGNATLAEDVLQEVFLCVHAKCGLYQDGWPARPWLYAIAIHKAVDTLRRARRHAALRLDSMGEAGDGGDAGALVEWLTGPESEPYEKLQDEERRLWVRENVSRLPEPHRQTLVLSYYQGLPYAEIAALLDIPIGTVKSRLHGALARLRASADRLTHAGSL